MNPNDPCPGGAMLIASGPAGGSHLYIIATNRCRDDGHLLLSISSIKDGRSHDPACVLQADEHPFVQRPSYVVYSKPEQRRAGHISAMIARGAYQLHDDVSREVLRRVCAGVTASQFSRPWAVTYFQTNAPTVP